jgi:GH24 family phage-related lysozyme (muramidase)
MLTITDKAKQLILEFEGKDQPGRWPGGGSGITIGIGYDLGYVTVDQFESDWEPCLPADALARLKTAIGKTGTAAKNRAPQFADIIIKPGDAESVFFNRTLPLHALRTEHALPGVTGLPGDVQGALLSLMFNRGTSMVGDRRLEMRAIRDAVPQNDLPEIARQLRNMKRLWAGKGLDGLIRRREAEARLVESCLGQGA